MSGLQITQFKVANQKPFRVFHNVPGKLMQIEDLKAQLKRNLSNSTAKARIEGLIRLSVLHSPVIIHFQSKWIVYNYVFPFTGMLRRSFQPSQTKHRWRHWSRWSEVKSGWTWGDLYQRLFCLLSAFNYYIHCVPRIPLWRVINNPEIICTSETELQVGACACVVPTIQEWFFASATTWVNLLQRCQRTIGSG